MKLTTTDGFKPLPSSDSARDVVLGVPGSIPRAVSHMVLRSALASVGIAATSDLRGGDLVKASLGVGVAIEVFALAYFAMQAYDPPSFLET